MSAEFRLATMTVLLSAVLLPGVPLRGQAPLRLGAGAATNSPGAVQGGQAALDQIREHLSQGRFAEARDQAQALVAQFPSQSLGWTYLGMASVRLGEIDTAVKAYERALTLDSSDPRPFFDVALLYASRKQLDLGIARFRQGLKIGPDNGPAWYNLGRLLLASRRLDEARQALERARALAPDDSGVHLALAEVLLRLQQSDAGIEEAKVVVESGDATPEMLVSVAALLRRAEAFELAGSALDRTSQLRPDWPPLLLEQSRLALARGRNEEAITKAQRAVELAPEGLEAHLALAEALISAGQDASAAQHLAGVNGRFSNIAEFQYTLGIAQFRAHDFHAAVASLQKAIEINPALDQAHFLLGSIALGSGDLAEAEQRLKAAIQLQPDLALYYTYLARVYDKKGPESRPLAEQATRQVLRIDPGDIESRERLARWAKDDGNLVQARELLEAIVADNDAYLPAHRLLAIVYHQMGLDDAARAEQQRLKELEQSSAADAPAKGEVP